MDLKAKLFSLVKKILHGIYAFGAFIFQLLAEFLGTIFSLIIGFVIIAFLFVTFSDVQEEAVGKNTLELLNERCGDVLEVENVTMPRLAFFEKAFEARVFLKNKKIQM